MQFLIYLALLSLPQAVLEGACAGAAIVEAPALLCKSARGMVSMDMRDTGDVWLAGTLVGGLMEAGQP